jgi:hypothetical protein
MDTEPLHPCVRLAGLCMRDGGARMPATLPQPADHRHDLTIVAELEIGWGGAPYGRYPSDSAWEESLAGFPRTETPSSSSPPVRSPTSVLPLRDIYRYFP